MVSESGVIAIDPMDNEPLTANGARWWRYSCSAGSEKAFLCIGEHPERPEDIVVTVGIDLQRLPFLWRLPRDWQLARRLAEKLEGAGAVLLEEED